MSRSYAKTVTTPTCLRLPLAIAGRLKSCHVDHKAHQRKQYLFGLEGEKSAGPCPDLGPGWSPPLGLPRVFLISKATVIGSCYRGTGRRTLPRVPDWLGEVFSRKSPDEKLEKAATDLSLVLRGLQKKCINQCNGVGLNLLVGAVSTEREGRGRLED